MPATLTHEQIFAAARDFLRDLNSAWDARPEEDGPVRESAEPEADPGRALADWYAELFSSFAGDAIPAKLRAAAAEDLAHGEWGIAQDEAGKWTVHHNAEVDEGPVRESEHTPFTGIDPHGHKWVNGKQVAIGDHRGAALAHTAQAQSHAAQAQGQPAPQSGQQAAAADYAQNGTRAKAFKEWFGDWEGDPEKASKVVNEQGEPQETHNIPGTGSQVKDKSGKPVTVYHGTSKGGFDAFDKGKIGAANLYGPGFYFTQDETIAREYQVNKDDHLHFSAAGLADLRKAFADALDPADKKIEDLPGGGPGFRVAHVGAQPPGAKEGKPGWIGPQDITPDVDVSNKWFIDNLLRTKAVAGKRQGLKRAMLGLASEPEGSQRHACFLNIRKPFDLDRTFTRAEVVRVFGRLARPLLEEADDDAWPGTKLYDKLAEIEDKEAINAAINAAGYDGIKHVGGDKMGGGHHHQVWIAFEPNQVKSVHNRGTFDPASAKLHESLDLLEAQARAPVGGITIAGTHFPGGRWIPGNVLAQATPEEKEKLNAADDDKAAARKARGPVDQDALKANLAQHSSANVTGGHAGVRRSYHALKRHHGELVLHRVEELHDLLAATLKDLPAGNSLKKAGVQRALAKLHAMMSVHDEPPKVKKHAKLDGAVGGGATGGLPAGQPLGKHPGEDAAPQQPGTGGGTGEGVPGLPAHDDVGGAKPGDGSDRTGDQPPHGGRVGHGATTPDGLVRDEAPTPRNPTDTAAANWHYQNRDFVAHGLKAKFNDNLAALKTMRTIQAEGRTAATPAEQEVMSKFVGWGQFPALFNERHWETKWKPERDALKALMSQEEWDSALGSIPNAHYTHPSVVDAHWQMAQRLGFKGGKFLETSAGIGYYPGMMPDELKGKTRVSCVEKDKITGAMLELLYPGHKVSVEGFEEHQAPDGFYDLVASNVPFGDYKIHEPRYNKHQAAIHDHFFLKSADLTRPGGLVMHVTSTGTLDKPDSSIRKELMKTCDLVSAVRFPGGTHAENAGTEVATDMIILRKRPKGEAPVDPKVTPPEAKPKEAGFTGMTTDSLGRVYHWVDGVRVPGPQWEDTATVPDPAGGEPIPVNQYFADHPEQVLGTIDRTGTMYQGDSANVSKTADYDARLAAAIARLPEGLMKPAAVSKEAFVPEAQPAPGDVKQGGYQVKGGKLYRREGGGMVEQKPPSAAVLARIQGHLDVRDARRAVINDELNGRDASANREKLNEAYDAFVAKYGPFHLRANLTVFKADPDAPVVLSLENYDPKTKTATKADMFRKDTVRRDVKFTHAGTVAEALGMSLHEKGGVDVGRMAELTGQSVEFVGHNLTKQGLAFLDPAAGWQPADQYLSGNVRQKLALAKAAAAVDEKFAFNVAALEKVQPEDVEPGNGDEGIQARLGNSWIDAAVVADFAAELLEGRPYHFDISFNPATSEWFADFSKEGGSTRRSLLATEQWGTDRVDFADILSSALNNKALTVRDPVYEDGVKVGSKVNKDATDAAQAKVQDLKDKFKDWVWQDDDRRERLARFYNDNFNNIRSIQYDGSHQTFPGMNPDIKLHPHIPNFVWQVVTTGKGLAAHEVGTGKTYSMIAAAMELRRLGLAKKPAIACLKANIEAITADAIKLYPGIKILSTADMFDAKSRKATMAKISSGDYDLIVMTHDHLGLLPMSQKTVQGYIGEEIKELDAQMTAAKEASGKKDNRIVKQLEKAKKRLEAKLKKATDETRKDDAINFEESGIDHLFVDEAHKFKTLPVYTKQDRVKGIPNGRSDRATNMEMRTRWLMENNGGRGVVFATGTPVANTLAELYTMQKYLQPEDLKARGITNFDSWASTFGEIEQKMEFTVTGEYKPVARFRNFVNVPELMQMTRQVMDVQRVDDMKDKAGNPQTAIIRPKRKDNVVVSEETPAMKGLMAKLVERAKNLKGPAKKGEDNMLVICTDGRKGAIDMRLLDADAPDDPNSKTNLCVENVLKIHGERPGVTQCIFSDIGVHPMKKPGSGKPGAAADDEDVDLDDADTVESGVAIDKELAAAQAGDLRFHLYGDIIKKLVAGGIPRHKIADFSELAGAKKEAAMEAMRQGEIVVAIGSTEKLGTGVNVQNKLAALHHLDIPWQPAQIEQRDGRGHRHGNRNDPTKPADQQHLDIHRYTAVGSMDKTNWQVISNKARGIKQVITQGNTKARVTDNADTEEMSPEQFIAVASGDPRVLEKVNLDLEVKNLKSAQNRHESDQNRLKKRIKQNEAAIPGLHKEAEEVGAAVKHLEAHPDFSLTVDSTTHDERPAAGEAFKAKVAAADAAASAAYGRLDYYARERHVDHIGTYRGLDVVRKGLSGAGQLYLRSPAGQLYKTGDTLGSVEHVARNLGKRHAEAVADADKQAADVARVKLLLGKPFAKADELKARQERLTALNHELAGTTAAPAPGEKIGPRPAEHDEYGQTIAPNIHPAHRDAYDMPTAAEQAPRRQQIEDVVFSAAANGTDSEGIHAALKKAKLTYTNEEASAAITKLKNSGRLEFQGGRAYARRDVKAAGADDLFAAQAPEPAPDHAGRLHALKARADADTTEAAHERMKFELAEMMQDMSKDQAIATAKEMGVTYPMLSKRDAHDEIARKVFEARRLKQRGTDAPAHESLRESADAAGHEHKGKGQGGGQFTGAIARHVAAAHAQDKHLPIDLKTLYGKAQADHPALTVPQFHDHLHAMQKAGTLTLHTVTRQGGAAGELRDSEFAMPLRDQDGTVPRNRHGEPWEVYGYATPGKTVHESLRESAAAPAAQHTPFTGIDGHGHKWVQGKQVAIGDHAGAAQAHTAAAQSHQAAHARSQQQPAAAGGSGSPAAAAGSGSPQGAAALPTAKGQPPTGAGPKFEVSPWLPDDEKEIEQQTQERAHAEYPALRDKYLKAGNGTFDAQGNLKSVVLNTDEWRPLFPEYNGVNAGAVHNASSHLNKQLYNEALQEQKGKGNGRLLILAGGGGSGKGTATGQFFKQSDYPLVLDQASDNYPKLEQKLDEAVKNGYKPLHVFIDRPPEAAWGGVVGRAVNLHKKGQVPRTVPLDIALKANVEARKATLDLLKRRPDIEVAVVDNVGGDPGSRRLLTDRAEAIAHLEKQIKGDEELLAGGGRDRLRDDVVRRVKSGEIPRHVGAGLIGEKELVHGLRAEVPPDHPGGAAAGPPATAGRPEPGRTAGTGGAGQAPHGTPAEGQGRTRGETEGGRVSTKKPPAPTGGQGGGARG